MAPSISEQKVDTSSPSLLTNSTTTHHYNKQLLLTSAFADCTITCQGRSWPAHRNILSPRCDFFKCCFDGRFSESGTRVIGMEDDDPVAVEGMLYYLYTLDFPREIYQRMLAREVGSGSDSGIEEDEVAGQDSRVYWGFDRLMYGVADKYGLGGLRELARRSLLEKAELAGQEEEQQLVKSMEGFVALVEDFYAVEEMISDHMRELRAQVVGSTCEVITHHVRDQRISALMADVPEFAVELVEALGKKREERRLVQREEDRRQEAARVRINHIPMNDESDCED